MFRREVMDHCEECGCDLREGDMAFSYDDGPTFCWQHAPTWNDLKREQDELIADGLWNDHFDDPEQAVAERQVVPDRIANGEGDRRVAYIL